MRDYVMYIYFDERNIEKALYALNKIPIQYRPTRYSLNEGGQALELIIDNLIDSFLLNRDISSLPFIYSDVAEFLFKGTKNKDSCLIVSFDCREFATCFPSLADQSGATYGFCCLSEELNQKNYMIIEAGIFKASFWVGMNYYEYIPSIYWMNYLTKDIMYYELICANLGFNSTEPIFLYQAFDEPEEWRNYTVERQLPVFQIDELKQQVFSGIDGKSPSEILSLISKYR